MPICFQKPEDEILSEYSSHWPTAIGKYVHVFVPFYYHVCVCQNLTVQGMLILTTCSEP